MNWQQAIDNNRDTLLKIILALVASLGLLDGGILKTFAVILGHRAENPVGSMVGNWSENAAVAFVIITTLWRRLDPRPGGRG